MAQPKVFKEFHNIQMCLYLDVCHHNLLTENRIKMTITKRRTKQNKTKQQQQQQQQQQQCYVHFCVFI
jgi:transcription initiation factor TFIID subunit TAF12